MLPGCYGRPQEPMRGVTGDVLQRSQQGATRRPQRSAEQRTRMTETVEPVLIEALSVIDRGLADLQQRDLVSATEVTDLLLDLRLLLSTGDVAVPAN